MLTRKPGQTDVTIYVRLRDSTTGLAKTGLVFDSAGASAYYTRPLAAATAITLATQTVTGAHADGGFVEVDATNAKGLYRLDLPDAVCAAGVDEVYVSIEFDGTIEETVHIRLDAFNSDIETDTQDIQGRLPAALVSGRIDASVGAVANDAITAAAIATGAIDADAIAADAITAAKVAADVHAEAADAVWDEAKAGHVGAGSFGEEVQAHALSTEVSAVETDTQDIQSRLPAALVGGRMDADVGNMQADVVNAAAIANAAIDAATFAAGAIDASAIAANAIGASELADGALTAAKFAADCITAAKIATGAIDADALATDAVNEIRDAIYADAKSGIVDTGTAQAVAAGSITLAAGNTLADDEIIGALVLILSATTGAGQIREVTDFAADTDVATISPNWQTTPTGTITYAVIAAPPATATTEARLAELDAANLPADVDAILADTAVIGTPAGADIAADIAAVKAQTAAIETDTQAIETDTQDIQSRLPAALVGGRMDASVGAMASNVLNAAAIATGAIDADALAADAAAEIADAVWDEDIVAAHGGADAAGEVLSQLTKRSVTLGTEVVAGSIIDQLLDDGTATYDRATDSLQAIRDNQAGADVGAIADAVWDEALSGHVGAGSAGERLGRVPNAAAGGNGGLPTVDANNYVAGVQGTKNTLDDLNDLTAADVNAEVDTALADIGLDHLVAAAVAGTDIVDDSIVAKLVSKSVTADWDSFDPTTDSLEAIRDNQAGADASAIADAVWDEARADHVAAGSFGEGVKAESLNTQAKADVNAEVDGALNTAIPGTPTANSINERVKALDELLEAGGAGDAAAILADTADMQPKLGTPAADLSADVAAVKTVVDAVEVDTQDIQSRLPAALVGGKIDADVGNIQAGAIDAAAIATGAVDADAVAADAANEIADALLDRANGVETSWTVRQALRILLASQGGKASGMGTSSVAIRDVGDTKDRITATVDGDGNRSAVTLDAT